MRNKLHRGHAIRILDWCIFEYGKSKYSKYYPYLSYKAFKNYDELGLLGYYEPETCTIFINSQDHPSLEELAKTIIEEYQHYMQSDHKYQKLYDDYDYNDHPLELEAQRIAKSDCKLCIKTLKKYHRSFHFR